MLASRSSSWFSATTSVPAIAQKISQFLSIGAKRGSLSKAQSATSQDIDRDTLDSLYRLARLITRGEPAATDLVTLAYRKAAQCGLFPCDHPQQLRRRLFENLCSAFYENLPQHQAGGMACDVCSNVSAPASVRHVIQQQTEMTRIMIFLRHRENLSLDEVAAITGHSPKLVQACLLQFRSSLHELCRQPSPSENRS